MNTCKNLLLLGAFALISLSMHAKTIIWDLGGVLFTPNKFKITLYELGLPSIIGYTLLDRKNPKKLQKKAFDILNRLGTQTGPQELRLKSPEGLELPQLFVDMLLGNVTPKEALTQSTELVHQLYKERVISSRREKKLMLRIMNTMFDSGTFVTYMNAIPAAADLIATCSQDASCEQFVLSNWDAHSFSMLYESVEGQKIFKHIAPEHITISGGCGLAKPDPAIFKYLIETHNLNPKECIFIDDNLENVTSAQACGLNTIYFKNMSHAELRKILIKHGFLQVPGNSSAKAKRYATV